jgi:hypothetical protein
LFANAGYHAVMWRRLNLFPNFTPLPLFRLLKRFEPTIEATPGLRALCTVDMYGYRAEHYGAAVDEGCSGRDPTNPTNARHQFPA